MTKVLVNRSAVAALAGSQAVRLVLEAEGEKVAQRAKAGAPRDSGAGAASIHSEIVEGYGGALHARVSWDKDSFYLFFHEVGTSRMPARPFLRPALDG